MKRQALLLLSTVALFTGCSNKTPSSSTNPQASSTKPNNFLSPATVPEKPTGAPTTATTATTATTSIAPAASTAIPTSWSFDKDRTNEGPDGFEFFTVGGKPGKWMVKNEPGAPSAPNVLAQLNDDTTDSRYAVVVATQPTLVDTRVAVRCRPVSGKVEQTCGVVLRFSDEKNYYLARANATGKDVNIYLVKNGKRIPLNGWKGATFGEAWHDLRFEAKGDHLSLFWDGTRVAEATEKSLSDAGKVGIWTQADSITYFDDLSVTPL